MASRVHPRVSFHVGSHHRRRSAPIRHRPSATPVRCDSRASGDDAPGVTLRRGVQSDADAIRAGVLRESMNPLGLDPTRFVVAVDDARGGEIVGFGQLKPWETLSDRPKDDVVGQLVRLMNLTPNWSGELLELASLVVTKERRGRGVGTAVARRLVMDAKSATGEGATETAPPTLCLLTLRSTIPFYERLGFQEIVSPEYVPRPLQAELALGRIVARLARNDDCVAMKMDWEML